MISPMNTLTKKVNLLVEIKNELCLVQFIPPGRYFSVKEVSKIKSIPENTIRTKLTRGKIKSVLYQGRRLISEENLEKIGEKSPF